MFEKILAKRALYKAGFDSARIEAAADMLLSPPNGVLTLDKAFFDSAPKGIGTALAKILPDSAATELRISKRDWSEKAHCATASLTPSVGLNLNFDTFGARYALADVIDALPKTKISALLVKNAELDADVYKAFARSMPKSKLETLHMDNTDIAPNMILDGMLEGVFASPIRSLNLANNDLGSVSLGCLGVAFAKGCSLEELDLSFNLIGHIRLGEMAEKMPPSLKTLKLNDIALVDPRDVGNMAEGLLASGCLKRLELRCTGLDERTLPELFKAFRGGFLESVDLSGNRIDDKTALALAGVLNEKKCRIAETRLGDTVAEIRNTVVGRSSNPVSATALARVNEAERNNANELRMRRDQEKAAAAVAEAGENVAILDAFTLAKAGKADVLMKDKALPASDLKRRDAEGKALIVHVAEAGQLAEVFKPEFWKNPKEMQETWDLVPQERRGQMDGKDGRPSFQHVKNKVMSDFVKNSVRQRSFNESR